MKPSPVALVLCALVLYGVVLNFSAWTVLWDILQGESGLVLDAISDIPTSLSGSPKQINDDEATISAETQKISRISKIPRRLIFVDTRWNILTTPLEPHPKPHLKENLLNTIEKYSEAWGQPVEETEIIFITNKECEELINQVEPLLLSPYRTEGRGDFKSDICRIAALYVYGGYYFDSDIEVLKPLEPDPHIEFVTANSYENGQFFQAFIFIPPAHPILKATLESMIHDWYVVPSLLEEFNATNTTAFNPGLYRKNEFKTRLPFHNMAKYFNPKGPLFMGTATLRIGFIQHNKTPHWFLDETENYKSRLFPKYVRNQTYFGCNYLVFDNKTMTPYFYSRCVGTWPCPPEPKAGFKP